MKLQATQVDLGDDAGLHFLELQRFRNVIDTSGLEAIDFIFRFSFSFSQCGHKNDRDGPGAFVGLQMPAYFESIHFRHHDVQQDEVGLTLAGGFYA